MHPLSIGDREDPVRLVFDAAPGPAIVVGLADLGEPVPPGRPTRSTPSTPDEPLPALPVARAVWTSRPDLRTSADVVAHRRRPPPHRLHAAPSTVEILDDFATIAGVELGVHRCATTIRSFRDELRWNAAWYHLTAGPRRNLSPPSALFGRLG